MIAPADGLIPAMIGIDRGVNLLITGKGNWQHWRGTAALDLSGHPTARMALGADNGLYRLEGKWAPAPFLKGGPKRLTTPVVNIKGHATLKDRILDGELMATTVELRAVAKGALDLANNRYRGMRLGIDLLKTRALFPNMTGKGIRMVWTLDGPFATADYSYRLLSDYVQFDNNGFIGLHAEGAGKLGPWPMRVPIRLSAKYITGIGEIAGAMLANPKIEGWLSITPEFVRGDGLRLSSAKWNGKISLLIQLTEPGGFQVVLSGAMQRYLIPGLGIVDVMTEMKIVPGPGGKGSTSSAQPRPGLRTTRQQLLQRPDRRTPVAHDQPRARERPRRPSHQPAALFAQASIVGIGPSVQRRHRAHRRQRAAGEIRAGAGGPRRQHRPPDGESASRQP